MSTPQKPLIGITLGDPKGIGPEVILKALKTPKIQRICRPIIFGDADYFIWKKAKSLSPKECGQLSGYYIEQAAHAALEGSVDAIVTGPICKEHLQRAHYPYPGHTEFLADLSGIKKFRMMMAGPQLRVVLVTIHEPLRKVASQLTIPLVLETIQLTHETLKAWFGFKHPRIAMAGLNPHAGESGMFGNEEKRILQPAIRKAHRLGIPVHGPFAPDTVFFRASRGEFDVVVALYHDQGLIPLKMLHFDEAVNITLGLPFIRTSVDHGTAFDIAGKGIAKATSMVAAIQMAVHLTQRKKNGKHRN